MIKPTVIDLEDSFIVFRYKDNGDIILKTQKNLFKKNTGLTILNPDLNIPAYVLQLSAYGTSIMCGHIIDNILGYLKNSDLEDILLIVDFDGVVEISESFAEQYIRFVLSTKSKVISINQNTNINNALSLYVESIIDIKEVTE